MTDLYSFFDSATSAEPLEQKTTSKSIMENTTTHLDKSGLWNLVLILGVALIITLLFLIGGFKFIGGTIGDLLIFLADSITDLGTKALQIFNGVVREIASFMLPVTTSTNTIPVTNVTSTTPLTTASTTPPTAVTSTKPLTTASTTPVLPVAMPTPLASSVPSSINSVEPFSSSPSEWCLEGEFQSQRSCVQKSNGQKCLSGQVFPTLDNCLIPNK